MCIISASYHMFGKAIWDKLRKCIFEYFESARVKQELFENFQKSRGWFIPKIAQSKYLLTAGNYK